MIVTKSLERHNRTGCIIASLKIYKSETLKREKMKIFIAYSLTYHKWPTSIFFWQYWIYATWRQKKEDGKTLVCDKRDRSITYVFCCNVFWSFAKRPVYRKGKFGGKVFRTRLLSRLLHKVCRLLSSPALLRKLTIITGLHHNLKKKMEGSMNSNLKSCFTDTWILKIKN